MDLIQNSVLLRNRIEEMIQLIENRIIQRNIQNAGKEIVVKNDIFYVWGNYKYLLQGVLYRWDFCKDKIDRILEETKSIPGDGEFFYFSSDKCELGYDFEDFLVSIKKITEEPVYVEISRHLSFDNKLKFVNSKPDINNENGLYWEINLLRNRAAHSTSGYYTTHNNHAAIYMAVSSKIRSVEKCSDKIKINTNLYSLRNNDYIQKVIKVYKIDKRYGEELAKKPLMELLFPQRSPQGKGKHHPTVLFPSNVSFFDMNEEFFLLSIDVFNLLIGQISVIYEEMNK